MILFEIGHAEWPFGRNNLVLIVMIHESWGDGGRGMGGGGGGGGEK